MTRKTNRSCYALLCVCSFKCDLFVDLISNHWHMCWPPVYTYHKTTSPQMLACGPINMNKPHDVSQSEM